MADNNMSVMLVVKAAGEGAQAQIEQFAKEAKADLKGVGDSGKSAASAVGETGAAASGLKSLASAAGVAGVAMGVFSEVGERIIGWVMDLPNKVLQAAQALSRLAEEAGNYGGSIYDASQITGLTAETLTSLKFAAEQSSISFDALKMSMVRQARFAYEAATGNEEMAEGFDALGISITDTNGQLKDAQTLFMETADALSRISNPTQRTALAMKVFGRGAAQILPLLREGSAGMRQMEQRARELGLVMSQETSAALDYYGDRVDAAKEATANAWRRIGGVVLPIIAEMKEATAWLADKLADVVEWLFGSPGDAQFAQNLRDTGDAAQYAADALGETTEATTALKDAQEKGREVGTQVLRQTRDAAYAVQDASAAVADAKQSETDAAQKAAFSYVDSVRKIEDVERSLWRTAQDTAGKLMALWRETTRAAQDAALAREEAAEKVRAAEATGAERVADAQRRLQEAQRSLAEERGEIAPLTEEQKAAQRVEDAERQLAKARDDAQRQVQAARDDADKVAMNEQRKREDLQTKWDELWVEVQRIREDAQKRIAEARESAVRAWQAALDSMAKAAGRVVDAQQQLARAIERQTDTLKDAATALRKALEDIKTARSESAAGTAGAVPQMAGGGYIPPGGAAIVGEQGPELFVPSQSGTIVPGAMVAAGAGGTSITINVQGGIYGDQRLVELIKSTVLDALRQAKYAT
jgi:hypothetical protein